MELIKQIIYLLLVMMVIYLVFYLFTYDVKDNGNQFQPKKNLPKIDTEPIKTNNPIIESKEVKYGSLELTRQGLHGTFNGPLKDGLPHSFGIFEYKNGDVFLGKYVNGGRNGIGYSCFKNGRVIIREYSGGEKIRTLKSEGLIYGIRKFTREGNWGTYTGPLKDNKPHGIGHYKYANDNIYIGNYRLGEREGAGNLILKNGDVLYQEYVNGELINSSTSF